MNDIPKDTHLLDDLPFIISLRRVNKGVGYVALFLPVWLILVTIFTETCFNASISHYYFSRIGGDLLVGSLSFIALLLAFFYSFPTDEVDGYRKHTKLDIWLAKIAGVSAFLIAFSPTTGSGCLYDGTEVARVFITGATGSEVFNNDIRDVTGTITYDFWASFGRFGSPDAVPLLLRSLHFGAAAVMFLILAYFSYFVFTRSNSSASQMPGSRKERRNIWYRYLGIAILLAVLAIGVKSAALEWLLSPERAEAVETWWNSLRLTFVFETIALCSFGLSWMIKGRFIKAFEDQAALAAAAQARAA
ncbi:MULTISPECIES: hypothetical protein [unclassified Roseovarius]|uniref:hypothetical protein n=1 Tax=unclassified Roseovarius TaxID=2614913 RepID=UPI00273E8029|nr:MULTISPECIES: hypothetical protein [unclassified Roseovarius]